MKTSFAVCGAALAATGLLGAGLTGCSTKTDNSANTAISAEDLQQRITDQLTQDGNAPKSVTCNGQLVGEVGKTTTCAVALSDTNSVEANVTVTSVAGSDVSFDLTPSLTKEQLQTAVMGIENAQTVTCESGLDGAVGDTANCEVTANGVTAKRVPTVEDVSGLMIDLGVIPVVPKEKIQEVLLQRLNADGTPAETVDCVDDVMARPGTSVECVAVTGDQKQGYDVSVTTLEGDNVGIEYKTGP